MLTTAYRIIRLWTRYRLRMLQLAPERNRMKGWRCPDLKRILIVAKLPAFRSEHKVNSQPVLTLTPAISLKGEGVKPVLQRPIESDMGAATIYATTNNRASGAQLPLPSTAFQVPFRDASIARSITVAGSLLQPYYALKRCQSQKRKRVEQVVQPTIGRHRPRLLSAPNRAPGRAATGAVRRRGG